jgi:peroxiredoxin
MVVFLAAGVTKLRDQSGFRRALGEFGVAPRLARPVAVVVPIVELMVAVGLVTAVTARSAALAALALLALFTAVMAASLARGERPQCRCFGQVLASPVGWRSLARNGVLGSIAGFVAWPGSHDRAVSATAWMTRLTGRDWATLAVAVVLAAALSTQGWLVLNLLRQQGRLLARLAALENRPGAGAPAMAAPAPSQGLPVGVAAPEFALPDLTGQVIALETLRLPGAPVLLVFSDPACGPCSALLPDIGQWQRDRAGELTVAVVSTGDPHANRTKATKSGVGLVLLQHGHEVAEAYLFAGTPSAVLVDVSGRIASPLVAGVDAVRALAAAALAGGDEPAPHPQNGNGHRPAPGAAIVGQPAPPFVLPDIDGNPVDVATFRGHDTVLLFWNPACGFCQKMVPALRNWEERRSAEDPVLILVARGSVEANRDVGLHSQVLMDADFSVAASFGATGTPMAVLVDQDGRVASPLAAGAQGVMPLATRGRHWLLADIGSER